jgi:hypothetical protein
VHNTLGMPAHTEAERVATLWQLAWDDGHMLVCCVYRDAMGFEMRVESDGVLVTGERCDLQPRTIARAQALRVSLVRRGWREQPAVPSL